ncbi:alginate lyase family protein [Jiulongibacter sediminis]|uniref:alginate lyase family protein n=1 Tax=Jiulongibacter sediminis TaxID=1605367 RepID=UPI000A808B8C|nr:alginate lyase family protein [Jiulongibacter sediminis]
MMRYLICFLSFWVSPAVYAQNQSEAFQKVSEIIGPEWIRKADSLLLLSPLTVTSSQCSRSEGGIHDFYSEGDYWWPDPQNPVGPYIRKDGLSNPDNFVDHRRLMERFNFTAGCLASAYLLTKDEKYAQGALKHYKAWFLDSMTYMSPHLLYGQAIKGRVSGRGIGIIDTIHLIEVAKALEVFQNSQSFQPEATAGIKGWFSQYLTWLRTHPFGIDERDTKNNHSTCWVMQVGVFAHLLGDQEVIEECRNRFKEILLPHQMGADGSFPEELARTKPYGYSSFNLEAMSIICQSLSEPAENLWHFSLADGRNMEKAMSFFSPYIRDKATWPYQKDVSNFEKHPIAYSFLIFAYDQLKESTYFDLWKNLPHFTTHTAMVRSSPVRNVLIWL